MRFSGEARVDPGFFEGDNWDGVLRDSGGEGGGGLRNDLLEGRGDGFGTTGSMGGRIDDRETGGVRNCAGV